MRDPHEEGFVALAGASLEEADGAVILVHGRGGSAADILALHTVINPALDLPEAAGLKLAWLAPEANGRSWYPQSFLAPRETNEPWLSSALGRIGALIAEIEAAGIPKKRIVLGGFSQGACLTTEFVASHPARYGGLMALTGGLVGPLDGPVTEGPAGSLEGMPAMLLTGVPDPHILWERVEESAAVLTRMGAEITLLQYPGRPHTVSSDEMRRAKAMLAAVFAK